MRYREELTAKGYDVPHEDDPEVHTHDPVRELSFRAFCELIVRIAAVLNQHMPTLERRVHALISQRMVPMIDALNSSGPLVQHPAKQIMEVPGVREALEELDDHLYELFEHARATEYAGLPKVSSFLPLW